MKLFLGYPIKDLDKEYNNTLIDINKPFDLKYTINTLYYCYHHNLPCIISDTFRLCDFKNGVSYFKNKHQLHFEWDYIINTNLFISNKVAISEQFFQTENLFYTVFFIQFINKNNLFYNKENKGINLIGNKNTFIGIYDSYREIVEKCKYCFYFSFGLNKFLLYKVIDKYNYVCGKLFNNYTVDTKFLMDKKTLKKHPLPSSFVHICKNIYGIKKKKIKIEIIDKIEQNIKNSNYDEYDQLCKANSNQNIYFFKINYYINNHILEKLFEYLVSKYPILKDKTNFYLVDPPNFISIKTYFSLYLIHKNNNKYLLVHFNQFIFQYLNNIVMSIEEFFTKLNKSYQIETDQYKLQYNKNDRFIHLVSEIYYLSTIIILKTPKIISNIKLNTECNNYTQVNYRFKPKEILNLKKNSQYEKYDKYLIKILISSISVFMDNYYIFIHSNNNIDVLPINTGMTKSVIDNYIEKSNKANLGKTYLISYLSKIFNTLDCKNIEMPIIFMNMINIHSSEKINIEKIYSLNDNKNIPMFINVVYGENSLVVNISYKPEYKKIKYIFNEIIDGLIC